MDPIISSVEGKREEEEDGEVVCRMVVGSVLVEKMRRETAAACGFQIRALSGDDAPPFAFPPDDNVNQLIQNSDQIHSPAQDGVMHVHARITEIGFEPGTAAMARLLVHSQQIGCLLGRGGHIVAEMRRATGASIRVFPKERSSRHGSSNDEIVQVIGNLHCVHDALFHITSRLRETIFPMRPPFPDSGPPYMPPYPEMPSPPFRPRHNPGSPCPYPSPVAHFRDIDHVPPPPLDHLPVFLHGMNHLGPNFDRVPHPYGIERHGHGSMYDRPPSPRSWTPQWNSCIHYYG